MQFRSAICQKPILGLFSLGLIVNTPFPIFHFRSKFMSLAWYRPRRTPGLQGQQDCNGGGEASLHHWFHTENCIPHNFLFYFCICASYRNSSDSIYSIYTKNRWAFLKHIIKFCLEAIYWLFHEIMLTCTQLLGNSIFFSLILLPPSSHCLDPFFHSSHKIYLLKYTFLPVISLFRSLQSFCSAWSSYSLECYKGL